MSKLILLVTTAVFLSGSAVEAQSACKARDVLMIGASWCPYCKAAKAFFRANNIRYVEADSETTNDPVIKYILHSAGGQIPIFEIGDRQIVGYNEDVLRDAICN